MLKSFPVPKRALASSLKSTFPLSPIVVVTVGLILIAVAVTVTAPVSYTHLTLPTICSV